MKDAWKIVPLEKVLRYRKEFIHISDLEKYKRCRVQCHVQGIVLRDLVEGTQIRTKNQQICKEGDFLVAEIDAKLGGFGIVPEELEGWTVRSSRKINEFARVPAPKVVQGAQSLKRSHNKAYRGSA